ncbi:MAG: type II secretion system secretin GspD [Thermodesulfovibrionales bacterium]|nr:type II secretion system secretin GspD [Thermodesulfovibrionales bacterium]
MTKIDKALILILITCFILFTYTFAQATSKKEDTKVTFNFVDVELPAIAKFISEITGKNLIFDERLKGKITIIAPSKLAVSDAYNLFLSVLELKGFTVIPSGVNAYKIIPLNEAKQKGFSIETQKQVVNEGYHARLYQLKHISSEEAMKFVQPLVSKDGHISTLISGNMLLIVDSGLNIEKIVSLIDSIDQPFIINEPDIVYLVNSSADAVCKIINDGIAKKQKGTQPQLDEQKAIADTRLNAVLLFGDKGFKELAKSIIKEIDKPASTKTGKMHVYFLEHADATEMVKVLEGILKVAQQPKQTTGTAAPVSIFEAQTSINVTADKSTNALIITASPSDYESLVGIIKQLDKRRRQVFVEATIVEASIEKLSDIGAKWRLIGKKDGNPVAIGGFGVVDSTALQNLITGLAGFSIGGMGRFMDIQITKPDGTVSTITAPGIAALFSLDEFKGAVNVLSTPQILTADNKEAEIVVGKNVPFISRRESDPTRTLSVFSSIERKDVGITLKITPQITEGDYVKLDIYQEISSVIPESQDVVISVGPTTTKRATKTSVVAKDSKTIVIGGLMQDREEESVRKVPLLGDIPLLGWAFKSKTINTEKTNLLVFITPHIIKDYEKMENITREKQMDLQLQKTSITSAEFIVRFKEDVGIERIQEILRLESAEVVKVLVAPHTILIRISSDVRGVEKSLSSLKSYNEIQYIEPNFKRSIK